MNFKTRLYLGNGILLSFLLVIAFVVFLGISKLSENTQLINHTYKVIGNGKDLTKYLIDMETGKRGFLIAGSEEYLEPFHKGIESFSRLINETQELVSDNPSQVARLAQIERMKRNWLEEIANPQIALRRRMDDSQITIDDLTKKVVEGKGKLRMDALRLEFKKFINEELAVLETEAQKARNNTAKNYTKATQINDLVVSLGKLLKLMVDMETGQRGFLVTGKQEYLEPYLAGIKHFNKQIISLRQTVKLNNLQALQLAKIENMAQIWIRETAEPEIELRKKMNENSVTIKDVASFMKSGRGKVAMDELRFKLTEFMDIEYSLMSLREEQAQSTNQFTINFTIFGTLLALIIGSLIASMITRLLIRQVGGEPAEIERLAEEAANGQFRKITHKATALTGINSSINRLITSLNEVVGQANTIAKGDYSSTITPRSEDDTLGIALLEMTKTLRKVTEENKKENWLKTGQSTLNTQMQGDLEIEELTQRIINFLADYLKGQVGVFYLLQQETLVLTSSFAYHQRNNNYNRLKIGEGLVGQVALEKKPILFTSIPEAHSQMSIISGIGESQPRSIYAIPILFEGDLLGVMALGISTDFSPTQIEFLSQISNSIGVSLNSSQSRVRNRQLLEDTKKLAGELEKQQEELRVANEELEEQTKALIESEKNLKSQQEELRVTNEELEKQARTLEDQQEELRVSNEELEAQTKQLEVQQKKTEEQNRQLEQTRNNLESKALALEEASRYKSEFLANMSHELRTPLNSLLILAEILKNNKEGNLSEKEVHFAETIHNSGNELLHLINEVLDLAKVEAGKMDIHIDEFPIDDLIDYIDHNFRHQIEEKGINFTLEKAPSLPEFVRSDLQKIHQILKNFMSNALKFTEKGTITFSVKQPDENADICLPDLTPKDIIAFTITDTGIGIPKEKQASIFEAFQQADGSTSRKYGGTGLGLSISRELIKILGGNITLKSTSGKGSEFSLYLPVSFTPEQVQPNEKININLPLEDNVKPESSPTLSPQEPTDKYIQETAPLIDDDRKQILKNDDKKKERTLLIIEDDPQFAEIVLNLAREKQFLGLVASDGKSGLQMAKTYKPHAIILDIGLPQMDGWSVMEGLKRDPNTRHIPVHFMSAMDKDIRAMKMGAIGFLTKPISQNELENAFQKIEAIINRTVRHLLIVEDDQVLRESLVELIQNTDTQITAIATGEEAYQHLITQPCDCLVLDLGLEDMSGMELLEKIKARDLLKSLPVIIFTGKELTREEERQLKKYSDSIIIKGAGSIERLLAEMTLFLHQVEKELPEEQQRMLQSFYDKDRVLENKTILLVDDDARSSFALSNKLEENQLEVLRAFDGKDALKALQEHPDVDLVLMDVMMPEMDGYETMQEIRRQDRFKNLPIIALTAKAMKDDRQRCLESGANDYLSKPVDTARLISLLRVWLF